MKKGASVCGSGSIIHIFPTWCWGSCVFSRRSERQATQQAGMLLQATKLPSQFKWNLNKKEENPGANTLEMKGCMGAAR